MKNRQLEAFRAVMLRHSVTSAAEMMSITQPAVTRLIVDLEEEVGFKLFTREKGRLFPTSDAALLYREVERSFVGVERIAHAARQIRSVNKGALTVCCAPALAEGLLPAWISEFISLHAGVTVVFAIHGTKVVSEMVANEQCDLGFITYTTWQPGVKLERLFTAPMRCILPHGHRLAELECITPEDLAGESFISFPKELDTRRIIDELFANRQIERQLNIECQLSAAIASFVSCGAGVSIIDPAVANTLGNKVVVRPFAPELDFEYAIVTSERMTPSRLTKAFLAFVKNKMKLLPSLP
ncbi:LysR substrate-binding domain-containing protein [Pseudomonas sp. G.S.17]|uniref:LysR substrate-binding domain-containing protein n=1 Tax=Pseudomonas sp. G.S.17 TaxID=3137451 RepID=UPI00311CD491